MTPKAAQGGLDTEQFATLLELVKGSKSVEMKLTIPPKATARRSRRSASIRSTGRYDW